MSSTNRGYDRHKADYYVTPHQPIKDFLSTFLEVEKISRPDRLIWFDPCAGGDSSTPMSYPTVIQDEFDVEVSTMDIREDSLAEVKGDYLNTKYSEVFPLKPGVIITNPPFNLALPIIKKSIEDVEDGGYVVMLLRLNFFGSKERKPFFEEFMPKYCFVHHKRISFIPDYVNEEIKKTGGKKLTADSIEYAHFVWKKCENVDHTKLYLL